MGGSKGKEGRKEGRIPLGRIERRKERRQKGREESRKKGSEEEREEGRNIILLKSISPR